MKKLSVYPIPAHICKFSTPPENVNQVRLLFLKMSHSIPIQNDPFANLPRVVKRHPYIDYKKFPNVVAQVLPLLKNYKRGDIQQISEHTGFKIRTLYKWADELKKDPNFDPLNKKCGQHCRVFTDAEEDAITDYIITNILLQGILFTDEDFEDLIMQAYLEKHMNDPEDAEIKRFSVSKGFIYDFKKNHRITSKKCHTKRRPANKKYDKIFVKDIEELFANNDAHYIINIDEAGWEVVPSNIRVWHMVGEDHVVRYINANDKEKVTVVAAITADGTKLPLQFIAKGKTQEVIESQIGDVGYHFKAYSENGWTTEETFIEYLTGLRNHFGFEDKHTLHIILDVFRAHITDNVKQACDELNIKLHLIPAGMTDELQPLDKKIFGPMKSYARYLFRNRFKNITTDKREERRTKKDACQDMVCAWERLSADTIQGAFEHFNEIGFWNIEDKSSIDLSKHHRKYCTTLKRNKKIKNSDENYKE